MAEARIVATDGEFRVVRVEDGQKVTYVLEKQDGFDALGVERWKNLTDNIGTTGTARSLFNWIIKHSVTCSHMKEMDSGQS